jgi:chromosome segregation ATPase
VADDLRALARERETQLSAATAIAAAAQPAPGSTLRGAKAEQAAAQRVEGATLSRLLSLEGRHHQLSRKYNVLQAGESAARARAATLQRELAAATLTAKQRILYLEKWKVWASAQLGRQQATLEGWAPKFGLLRNQKALALCKTQLRDTVAKEAMLRSAVMRNRELPQKVEDMQVALDEARAREAHAEGAAARLRIDCEKMRAQLTAAVRSGRGGSMGGGASSARRGGGGGGGGEEARMLEFEVARLTDCVHDAEALRDEAEVRAERAEGALGAARAAQAEAEAEARSGAEELRRVAFSLAEEERESEAAHEARRVALARAEEERARMEGELEHCEKTLDLMTKQARALARAADDAAEEDDALRALRDELLELSSRDDDSAIIGKMQRELMQAKAAAQHAARKFEAAMHSLRERELGMRRIMFRYDRQRTLLLELKESATERELAHRQVRCSFLLFALDWWFFSLVISFFYTSFLCSFLSFTRPAPPGARRGGDAPVGRRWAEDGVHGAHAARADARVRGAAGGGDRGARAAGGGGGPLRRAARRVRRVAPDERAAQVARRARGWRDE